MNLQRVPKTLAHGSGQWLLTTQCCYKMQPIGMVLADLDAPAFGAFWCEDCARGAGHEMPDAEYQLYPRV